MRVFTAAAVLVLGACTTTGTATTTSTTEAATTTSTKGATTTSSTVSTTTVVTPPLDALELGRAALQSLALSSGDDVDLTDLGFAATVSLGVHNVLSVERSLDDLRSADGWTVGVSEYAGFAGPFSALETLRTGGPLVIEEGEHPHCAGPPLDPPAGLENATRVHAQPKNVDSCIPWFSVDLWIVDGSIQAVTLELFGP